MDGRWRIIWLSFIVNAGKLLAMERVEADDIDDSESQASSKSDSRKFFMETAMKTAELLAKLESLNRKEEQELIRRCNLLFRQN